MRRESANRRRGRGERERRGGEVMVTRKELAGNKKGEEERGGK